MKLIDQQRTGLFPEHECVSPATHNRVRLTIPAMEALEAVGATVEPESMDMAIGVPTFTVTLSDRVPDGLTVAATYVSANRFGYYDLLSLRMDTEPPYADEREPSFWRRLDFAPCPKCGAPLVWYEAAYVPGYRVCARKPHHHWLAE